MYGVPVVAPLEQVSESYEPGVGEKLKLTFVKSQFTLNPFFDVAQAEANVINSLKEKFSGSAHWKLHFAKIVMHVISTPLGIRIFSCSVECHVEALNPLTVATATAIIILVLGLVIAVTWVVGVWLFLDFAGGVGGMALIGLLFILAFVVIGGELETSKVKVRKKS